MLETTFQNDTILKNLDQSVELNTPAKIQITRKVLEPTKIRLVDSISRQDSIKKSKSQNYTWSLSRREAKMDSLPRIEPLSLALTTESIKEKQIVLPEKQIERDRPDWAIGVFIIAFVIFASVRIFFNKYLAQLFNATLNYSTASRLFRERSLNLLHAAFRLDVLFMIVFSFFLFQSGRKLGIQYNQLSVINYFLVLGSVIGYFFLKRFAYLTIGFTTESILETQEHLYNMDLYNRVLGLLLLPVSLLIAFSTFSGAGILYFLGFAITLTVYLLSILRGLKILMRKHFSIFYLILYLCTLEILPLVFVCKLMVA